MKLRMPARWACALLLLAYLEGCGQPAGQEPEVETPQPVLLQAAGSGALQPLLDDLMAARGTRAAGISLNRLISNSQLGWDSVLAGESDLGLVSWGEPPPGAALQTWRVARDGIAVVVHPSNPLTGLSLLQLRELFAGRIWEWRGVGADVAGGVQVISREQGSGTRAAFEALAMDGLRVTPTALVMPSGRSVVKTVAENPDAIGYVSMGLLSSEVKAIKVEGVLPGPLAVTQGRYPLSRDLTLVAPKPAAEAARALAEFALSPAGQEIVGQRYGRIR